MQIRTNWERSGNGDGNTNDQDDTLVDDNRSTLLAGNKTHIFYFWEQQNAEDLLQLLYLSICMRTGYNDNF